MNAENLIRDPHASSRVEIPRFNGSKRQGALWKRIISEMPPHRHYVEPFLGTGHVARKKRPAATSLLVDVDPNAPGLVTHLYSGDVQCRCGCALAHLRDLRRSLDSSETGRDTVVYCDPPYLFSTRSGRRYYDHEFGEDDQHRELLAVLSTLDCHVMVSGYRSDLYEHLLADWRMEEIPTVNRAGKLVIECLWCNFPKTELFHDSRWLGKGFRERERQGRKIRNLVAKLGGLSPAERARLAAALAEKGDAAAYGWLGEGRDS